MGPTANRERETSRGFKSHRFRVITLIDGQFVMVWRGDNYGALLFGKGYRKFRLPDRTMGMVRKGRVMGFMCRT